MIIEVVEMSVTLCCGVNIQNSGFGTVFAHVLNSGFFNYHGFTITYLDKPYIHLSYRALREYHSNLHYTRYEAL
jgi:hypothetical protein